MPKRRYELDPRILTVFFFVAIPFVAFGALVVINLARLDLQTDTGIHLEQRAQEGRLLVERYVLGQFVQLRLLSLDPQVRQAVAAAPTNAPSPGEAGKMDQAWGAGDAALVASVVDTPLAARLRELGQVQPALKLLQVVDGRGRLLATTIRGGRVLNAEAPWFRSLGESAVGGRPYYCGISQLPGGAGPMLEMAYPIRQPEDGRLLGAVRALFDVDDLYSVLAPLRVGRTGHATLLRGEDGLILAADESSAILKARFSGFEFIEAAVRERKPFWLMPATGLLDRPEPRRVVGFATVEQIPGVYWMVAVEQDVAEAMAPIRNITYYLIIHFVGVFTTAILLALYFSFKLERPVIQDELHLHDEHVPERYRESA